VLGYTAVFPLTASAYITLRDGINMDGNLNVRNIDPSNPFGLYIASIASLPEASKEFPSIGSRLVFPLVHQVNNSPYECMAIAVSDVGGRISKNCLGMHEIHVANAPPGYIHPPKIFIRDAK
jgi:hypothetical protein